jgi:hypothetical protein
MSTKIEIFAAHIGKGAAATALADQFNTNEKGFTLINQCAQTIATVTSISSITAVTPGFMPFVSGTAHVFAGTTTFLKIIAESQTEEGFDPGDLLTLTGNVAGVIGSVILLGGLTAGTAPLALAAIVIGGATVLTSDVAKNFLKTVIIPFWEKNFKETPGASYTDHWIAPDLKLASLAEIQASYENKIGMVVWDPATDEVTVASVPWDKRESPGGEESNAQGASPIGVLPLIAPACPLPTPPVPEPETEPQGEEGSIAGQPSPSMPTAPTPVTSDAELEISIIELNGVPEENPEKIKVDFPPIAEPEPPQDQYGCCTGTQDSYS